MADPVMPYIQNEFRSEKEWIQKRLAENRERFEDDVPFVFDKAEARSFGLDEDEV
jgi:hypothetical protein